MKIIRGLAALFIFTSVILPSIAYADEKTIVVPDVEKNVEQDSEVETGSPLEEETKEDSLIEADDSTVEESDSVEKENVENLEQEQLVDESLVETELSLEELTEEPEEDIEEKTIEKATIVEQEMMSVKSSVVENKASLLGHLKGSTVRIYKDLDKPSDYVQAGPAHTNAVYYIKKQANYNGELYYLISKNASSTSGVVGWVKSADISTNAHVGVNRTAKTYYVKGTGSAYAKAWGGSKDIVFNKLSDLKGQQFKIDLTERVGKNTWHRGILNGKTAWVHSSYLTQSIGVSTSRLGHLKSTSTRIYDSYTTPTKYVVAGSSYTNEVYYIKRKASHQGTTYYLISGSPSNTTGVVGWVKSMDVSTHTHVSLKKTAEKYFIKGTGSAYNKAWGGSKNLVNKNLSGLKDQEFVVNLTERVGNNTWYRGTVKGRTVWIHGAYLAKPQENVTSRLGHIKSNKARIYTNYSAPTNFEEAGSTYTNEVYYIKKEAIFKNERFYLISRNASSTNGVIGWVKAADLSTNQHRGVDRTAKMYYFKGGGTAYTKVWGGSKNINVSKLESRKGDRFQVNLTEKVGKNTWYRGTLNGKTAWVHSAYISTVPLKPAYINGVLIASKKYPLPKNHAPGESKQARSAFNQMAASGKKAGFNLTAFSTYRSYDYQKGLFDRYVKKNGVKEANRFSARPGQSEHQTGLAFDVGEVGKQKQWARQAFGNTNAGKWIAKNAHHSGFIVRYPKGKEAVTGYIYEPWHLRYVGKELATKVYKSGLTLEEYLGA